MASTSARHLVLSVMPPKPWVHLIGSKAAALLIALLLASPAWATGTVLSGVFDGSEPSALPITVMPLEEIECTEKPKAFLQSTFQVSASGTYRFKNAFGQTTFNNPKRAGIGVSVHVYEGPFDVSAPEKNLIASTVYNWLSKRVRLTEGIPYVLVVQQWCTTEDGVWAVTFTGPGSIHSEWAIEVPAFTSGNIPADSPSTLNSCLSWWDVYTSRYQQIGPVRVSRDGLYHFADSSQSELCLTFFTAPFNPDNWSANYLTTVSEGFGPVELKAGQDYYLIAQLGTDTGIGDYFFVLAPPAPFRINPALSDSWFNPATPGQGFFLDVMDQLNKVFLGWFNFEEPATTPGAFNHRWLTALGPISGTTAELAIEWTTGGAFDAAQPEPSQHRDGTIRLEFSDCNSAQVHFSWNGLDGKRTAQSGVIPIERISNDSVALCESLYWGPGLPGPL